MLPIATFAVLEIAGMGLNSFIRTCGHPRRVMINSVAGALLNVLLDYIFMARMGMGMEGAALGTVISQAVVFIMVHSFFLAPSNPMRWRIGCMKPAARVMWQVFRYGLSPFLLHLAFVITAYLINTMLIRHRGDAAVSAYGIVNTLIMLIALPTFGIVQAMQSIAGYNFGARKWARLKQALDYALVSVNAWMLLLSAILWLFRERIIGVFDGGNNGAEMIALAAHIASMLVLSLPLFGTVFVVPTYMLATGQYKKSLAFNMTRQFLFLIPLIVVMPRFFGFDGVLWGIVASDYCSIVLAYIILAREYRKLAAKAAEKA
jgi:putative MATE family efflux protein